MLIDGIEVHQATKTMHGDGASYKEGDWVVLMDQPFAALVKELFDVQKYPQLPGGTGPAAAAAGQAAAAGGRGAGGGRGAAAAPAAAEPTTAAATPAAAPAGAGGGRGGGGGRGAAGGGGGGAGAAAGAQAPPAQFPYDVTGWTLPMQMGVEVQAITQPIA